MMIHFFVAFLPSSILFRYVIAHLAASTNTSCTLSRFRKLHSLQHCARSSVARDVPCSAAIDAAALSRRSTLFPIIINGTPGDTSIRCYTKFEEKYRVTSHFVKPFRFDICKRSGAIHAETYNKNISTLICYKYIST